MSYIKTYHINKWKYKENGVIKYCDSTKAPIVYIDVEKQENYGSSNEYCDYRMLEIYTGSRLHKKFHPYFKLKKKEDGSYEKIDKEFYLGDYLGFKKVEEFDSNFNNIRERLNKGHSYYSSGWESYMSVVEYDKRFDVENSYKQYKSYEPYKVMTTFNNYINDNNEKSEDLGVIWQLDDTIEIKILINSTLSFTTSKYDNFFSILGVSQEKKWYWIDNWYVIINNKEINKITKYHYIHEELKTDNM